MDIGQKIFFLLSSETFRWFLVGTLVLRMLSVSIINHLTWRKLLSLTVSSLVSGLLAIGGASLIDMLLPALDFQGYPEIFLALFLVVVLIAQFIAKLIGLAIEAQSQNSHKLRQERIVALQVKAASFVAVEEVVKRIAVSSQEIR